MTRPLALDAEAWAQRCRDGQLITRGPLNDTYRVTVRGGSFFVRHRTVFDAEYGQTFAGERSVPPGLAEVLGVPRLWDVVADDQGRETFAIFEWVSGRPVTAAVDPDAIARLLAAIHLPMPGFGIVAGPYTYSDAPAFIGSLIEAELDRLDPASRLQQQAGAAGRAVLAEMECFRDEAACLCHGDIHADNLLIDNRGGLHLVDWEAIRCRVAASDFNQLHQHWLSEATDLAAIAHYAELKGRDLGVFTAQVFALRCLWHLRTFNFHRLVRSEPARRHEAHLEASVRIAHMLMTG
jgi:aminoglycoside phosphotransferase (APT) family kinase protein